MATLEQPELAIVAETRELHQDIAVCGLRLLQARSNYTAGGRSLCRQIIKLHEQQFRHVQCKATRVLRDAIEVLREEHAQTDRVRVVKHERDVARGGQSSCLKLHSQHHRRPYRPGPETLPIR